MVINAGINNPGRKELETELFPEGIEIKILAWKPKKKETGMDNKNPWEIGMDFRIPIGSGIGIGIMNN